MGTVLKCVYGVFFGVFILTHHSIASTKSSDNKAKIPRIDLIDKAVLALKSAFLRALKQCDSSCRADRNAKRLDGDMEEASTQEALELIAKLKSGQNVDLGIVSAWLEQAGDIQRNYFNSVFRYHKDGDVKDALFYLDIGEPHKAAKELLSNQRVLTQIVADCSTFLETAQGGRGGIPFKLLYQLTDLTPYHIFFGCLHSTTGRNKEPACATVMKSAFEASFIELQDTLSKFFTTEMSEEDLLGS
ncbi:uncharacterized protein LOC111262921 [Varroa jacobsoni]|uniref:uncharacterized protein LOC111262921 n=1 Tax=Varroa jacobsoni TaxID=62625 RepID=UPI000BF4D925|nr:uncharacterized protein LOC111262921 [Varroa jacobsoni]